MKLGISYVVFEGVELIESSINQIRPFVDYINIVYQKTSYYNDIKCSDNLEPLICRLIDKGLIDEAILYEVDHSFPDLRRNEYIKRNIGLKYAKKNGCDYFMTMDCDEFYYPDQFLKAKNLIIKNGYKATFCKFINYFKEPTYKMNNSTGFVQFISKIEKDSKFSPFSLGSPVIVDPTRFFSRVKNPYYIFSEKEVTMQHMCMVRKDILTKIKSNSLTNIKAPDDLLNGIEDKVEKVDNFFQININVDLPNDLTDSFFSIKRYNMHFYEKWINYLSCYVECLLKKSKFGEIRSFFKKYYFSKD